MAGRRGHNRALHRFSYFGWMPSKIIGANQNGNKHNLDKEHGLDISISFIDSVTGASSSDIDHSDVTVLPVTDLANISSSGCPRR